MTCTQGAPAVNPESGDDRRCVCLYQSSDNESGTEESGNRLTNVSMNDHPTFVALPDVQLWK